MSGECDGKVAWPRQGWDVQGTVGVSEERGRGCLTCRNDDGGYSFVYKQPESPEEEARCKEAKEGCPVEAIGDNGA